MDKPLAPSPAPPPPRRPTPRLAGAAVLTAVRSAGGRLVVLPSA